MALNNLKNSMHTYIMTVDFVSQRVDNPFVGISYGRLESPLTVNIRMNDYGLSFCKENEDFDQVKIQYKAIKRIDLSAYYRSVPNNEAMNFNQYFIYFKVDMLDGFHFEFESRDYSNLRSLLLACLKNDVDINDYNTTLLNIIINNDHIDKFLNENWSMLAKARGLNESMFKYRIEKEI